MAIPLTGAGALGTRLGHLFGGLLDVLALAGGAATARVLSGSYLTTRIITTITPDYSNGTALPQELTNPNLMQGLGKYQQSLGVPAKDFSTIAANTLRSMYAIDQLGASATAPLATLLAACTLEQAVRGFVNQMTINTTTVQSGTLAAGAQTALGTPVGNPTINVSMKSPQGLAWALCLPETIFFQCVADSLTGGTGVGNESFTAKGQPQQPPLSYLFPGGSGCNAALSSVSGQYNNSNGNLIVGGNFPTFSTANYPDNFAVQVGVVGTAVLNGGATAYLSPGGSVEFVGDSSTLTCLVQPFNSPSETGAGLGGSPAIIQPNTVYHGCVFYKLSAGSPAAGTLEVALVDGSGGIGVVINNDQAVANSATKTLNPVADTNWHALTFAFQTPMNMPITVPVCKFRIRLSVALTTGTNIFLSNFTLTPAVSLYPGGPFASVHAGVTRTLNGLNPDTWTVGITNNYATSGSGLWHFCFERAMAASGFSLQANGLQLPVTGSPTISDALCA